MSNLEGVSNFTKGPTKKTVVTKEENAKQTMAAILAVDPLNDRAFKKLIESVEWFQEIVQLLLERNIPDGTIISIQGEAALTVNGKLIRMDNLRKTPLGSVNLEAQNVTSKFTYKRHLFYGALAYAFGLQAGEDYAALQPTISIVLYKNKTGSELFQNAKMSGSLIRTKEDEDLFRLLSVNTAKWNDAKSTKLKQLLAILHNGHYSPKTANLFKGVDVDSDFFKKFSRAVLISSAEIKFEDCESKGDLEMSSMLKGYLTEEQEKEAEDRGEVKGQIKMLYTDFNMSIEDIAKKLNISQSKVSSVLENSGLIK